MGKFKGGLWRDVAASSHISERMFFPPINGIGHFVPDFVA